MSAQCSISQKKSDVFIFEKSSNPQLNQIITDPYSISTSQSSNKLWPHLSIDLKPCYLPAKFQIFSDDIRNFKVRKDDVWIISYPKTGTTLLQNIVWQLKNGLDFTKKPISLDEGQFLEIPILKKNSNSETIKGFDAAPSPRTMKSHLPLNLLPMELWTVRPKIVYIARNPKDTAISMYHMFKVVKKELSLSLEDFFDLFLNEMCLYGSFSNHVLSFWHLRHLENVLFLTYEDLLADRFDGIKKIAQFLECKYRDRDLEQLTKYTSFDQMKKQNTAETLQNGILSQHIKIQFVFISVQIYIFIVKFG